MLKRSALFLMAAALIVLLAGCGTQNDANTDYAQIYMQTFDAYFEVDQALHEDIQYVAIDMDTLLYATDADKKEIEEHFSDQFHVPVKEASFKDLQNQGLVGEGNSIDGILLSISSVNASGNTITIEGSKFRSGIGANGMKTVFKKKNGLWELESSEMIWIS